VEKFFGKIEPEHLMSEVITPKQQTDLILSQINNINEEPED
jgi:hypothetical protein